MWRPTGLIPWFSKLREILMLHFAASTSSLRGKPTQAQDVARTHARCLSRSLPRDCLTLSSALLLFAAMSEIGEIIVDMDNNNTGNPEAPADEPPILHTKKF